MITVVTKENQAAIPVELMHEFNIKPGTRLDWSKDQDGNLRVKPLPSQDDKAIQRTPGIGRDWEETASLLLGDKTGRVFGAMRGKAVVSSAFFEELPEDELRAWESE
jgi:bifunctional DNA-binding transcriptional regulator/antitoxin component of YhaV-PrlF toxin-antitoxin module